MVKDVERATAVSLDMTTELCGITLENPVIPASETFGYGYEYAEFYDINLSLIHI